MIRIFKHDQGRKTENLKRILLQYIQTHDLKPGDRLPSQSVLRSRLGLSGTTIIRAIKGLEDEHILEVRDKVGTFLAAGGRTIPPGCTAALLAIPDQFRILPQYPIMMSLLQNKLFRLGIQPAVFPPEENANDDVNISVAFPKLESVLSRSRIDAVVDFYSMADRDCQNILDRGIPYFRLSAVDSPLPGVYIDTADFFRRALREMLSAGCRYPLLITMVNPSLEQLWLSMLQEELPQFRKNRKYHFPAVTASDGIQLASQLASAKVWPDSFLFMDDSVGLYFLSALERLGLHAGKYDPFIVSSATAELPLLMPRDNIVYYEIRLDEIMDQMSGLVAGAMDIRGNGGERKRMYQLKRTGMRSLMINLQKSCHN